MIYEVLKAELENYDALHEKEWELIKAKFTLKEFKKGDYYLQAGQVCRRLGFITKGFLRSYSLDETGNELTTHFAYDKSFAVSFYSFKNQVPSFEYIKPLEDTQVLEIDYSEVQHLFATLPKWGSIYRKIIEEAYACLAERNHILQNLPASKRYELLVQKAHPLLVQKAQLGHIASYLGIKQETLSRIRRNLS